MVTGLAEYNNGMYIIHARLATPAPAATAILHPTPPPYSRSSNTESITIRARQNRRPPRLHRKVPVLNNEPRVPNKRRILERLILLIPDLERQRRGCNHHTSQSVSDQSESRNQIRTPWAERQLPFERRPG